MLDEVVEKAVEDRRLPLLNDEIEEDSDPVTDDRRLLSADPTLLHISETIKSQLKKFEIL
jgi:hypothetical protein